MSLFDLSFEKLISISNYACSCGKLHSSFPIQYICVKPNALSNLKEGLIRVNAKKIFVVADKNTELVAGKLVTGILEKNKLDFKYICLHGNPQILPNEEYTEILEQICPKDSDFILGVGSGVINDLCKYLAFKKQIKCGIVGTAPSMDGYASNSSAMELQGIKTTVYTTAPSLIICDINIIKKAPFEMISAGFGDMIAKIISIADWKIANIITGEYYCEETAQMMQSICHNLINEVKEIRELKECAIQNMTEGLIMSGIASLFTGTSRPASGMEHTISHLLEMFALAEGKRPALHGLQVGYGVREALSLYQKMENFKIPSSFAPFNEETWETNMKRVFKSQANALIQNALREKRNTAKSIAERRTRIIKNWKPIKEIIRSVNSEADLIISALDYMNIPNLNGLLRLGYTEEEAKNALYYSKDLRKRYIFTSFCSDIGAL